MKSREPVSEAGPSSGALEQAPKKPFKAPWSKEAVDSQDCEDYAFWSPAAMPQKEDPSDDASGPVIHTRIELPSAAGRPAVPPKDKARKSTGFLGFGRKENANAEASKSTGFFKRGRKNSQPEPIDIRSRIRDVSRERNAAPLEHADAAGPSAAPVVEYPVAEAPVIQDNRKSAPSGPSYLRGTRASTQRAASMSGQTGAGQRNITKKLGKVGNFFHRGKGVQEIQPVATNSGAAPSVAMQTPPARPRVSLQRATSIAATPLGRRVNVHSGPRTISDPMTATPTRATRAAALHRVSKVSSHSRSSLPVRNVSQRSSAAANAPGRRVTSIAEVAESSATAAARPLQTPGSGGITARRLRAALPDPPTRSSVYSMDVRAPGPVPAAAADPAGPAAPVGPAGPAGPAGSVNALPAINPGASPQVHNLHVTLNNLLAATNAAPTPYLAQALTTLANLTAEIAVARAQGQAERIRAEQAAVNAAAHNRIAERASDLVVTTTARLLGEMGVLFAAGGALNTADDAAS
ncbi:hypothetical protein K402DRAFT_394509, partial [Aulographum hederae CBS 113979]